MRHMKWLIKVLRSEAPIWLIILVSMAFGAIYFGLNRKFNEVISRSKTMDQSMAMQLNKFNHELKKELDNLNIEYTRVKRMTDSIRVANYKSFPISSQEVLREVANGIKLGEQFSVFQTSSGPIRCNNLVEKDHDGNIAYIRFGNINSQEDGALIKQFIEETTRFKLHKGYRLIESKTKEEDYGESISKSYEKGDLYFRTYFRYSRNSGTYNTTYYTYTYYIEVGSLTVKKNLEDFSTLKKIGS